MRTMLKRAPLWTYPNKSCPAEKPHKLKDPEQSLLICSSVTESTPEPSDPRSKMVHHNALCNATELHGNLMGFSCYSVSSAVHVDGAVSIPSSVNIADSRLGEV